MSLGATTEYYRSGLADDSLKDRSVAAFLRGKAAGGFNRSTTSPVAEHVPEGASSTSSTSEGASPVGRQSRNARSAVGTRVAGLGRSRGSSRSIDTEVAVLASDIAASFTCTCAEAKERVLPRSVEAAEAESMRRSYPFGASLPKRRGAARVPPGFVEARQSTEVERRATVRPRDASRRRATEVERRRKTRSGNATTSPMGFSSFRRLNPGDRCVGLPHRHHPLSEFLTPSAV